jgi:redox-sensitive bicupin YhaK (pirin superfamily)
MRINKIPFHVLYTHHEAWRTSRYHFSFADYIDPKNNRYGVLRALNDELIQPKSGFDLHPHEEMEIISYCVQGEMSHSDSMGNQGIIRRGDVQYMCAGSGVTHAEMNESANQTLRFMQIWILPNQAGLSPQYKHTRFSKQSRHNKLLQIASGSMRNGAFQINQDANVFVAEIQKGKRIQFDQPENRQDYLVCIEGKIEINSVELTQYEAAQISCETQLVFTALEDSHLLLVEMPEA